jgi:hypothetical protein
MSVEFGEPKIVDNLSPSEPILGSFSLQGPLDWRKCREQFAKIFTENTEGFFFSHPNACGENVAAFLVKTEDVLGASHKTLPRSKFSKTNMPYALWVSPSDFWKECPMRRSLLTILLRCGFEYRQDLDNYEEALFSDVYAKETQNAVKRFLFGYTRFINGSGIYVTDRHGWRESFINKMTDDIRVKLVRPNNSTIEPTLIGLGTIWN